MDAIIRAATVSKVAFELRRPGRATAPAAPTPVAAPAPVAAARTPGNPAAAAPSHMPAAAQPAPAARAVAAAAAVQAEAAQQEAARRKAQAELAELRADAERVGYKAGYEAGHQAGELDARRQLQTRIDRFQVLAEQLADAREGMLAAAEDGVVELAFAALCRILGEQAATREGVLAMVARCAAGEHEREQVGVRLHPDDYALLGPESTHLARFSPDPGIVLGGCIVDSATGSLDARLETQLARLAETLSNVRAARRHAGDAGDAA